MLPDKEIKKKYKPLFWKDPDKFYPTSVLKAEGFTRKYCKVCKKPFWNLDSNREICGDPSCAPGESFAFIGKTPAKEKLTYIDVWKRFSKMFEKFGYTPIKRYPCVARWNPTMEYTNASIAAFQPYVISGEVSPPANPLVIPQFCLRFGDIDNVGITQSHNTGFIMIGQHMFVPPKDWDQNKVFQDIYSWITKGLGLPKEEVTFHEDAWAGGGNLGCCMEFFSRGCELGNQVYMLYEQVDGIPGKDVQDLKLKVLDMGMGMERNAWFSQGEGTIYDATFPTVIKKLKKTTGVKYDESLMQKYIPHGGRLNLDEVENIDESWKEVSRLVEVPVDELKELILPMAGVYSVAEHSRSLLFALADGALPSNVGGGYNLRVLARRAFSFIEKYQWDVDMGEVCEGHAKYLKPLFPELAEHLDDVKKILDVEQKKFLLSKEKARVIVAKIIEKDVTPKKLAELYDSQGINPETVSQEAKKIGKTIMVPDNFFTMVSALHDNPKKDDHHNAGLNQQLDLAGIPGTKAHYYDKWKQASFTARIAKIVDRFIILEETYFYPTSGGQDHDTGTMKIHNKEYNVTNIFKQGPHIIHLLDNLSEAKPGDSAECSINMARRMQLTQHHTSTHIINAAAKRVLGNHINQAGAKKTVEYAHIDLTHYESISDEDLKKIEQEANKIIRESIPVKKNFFPREEAEKKYGMAIYQGGAVPGKQIRIVEIPCVDVEACGGTHLDNTKEAEEIIIIKSSKIQDGVVRLTFVAGPEAKHIKCKDENLLKESAKVLGVNPDELPARAAELFEKWKAASKAKKKSQTLDKQFFILNESTKFDGDALTETARILQTQPEHVPKTLKRFNDELDAMAR